MRKQRPKEVATLRYVPQYSTFKGEVNSSAFTVLRRNAPGDPPEKDQRLTRSVRPTQCPNPWSPSFFAFWAPFEHDEIRNLVEQTFLSAQTQLDTVHFLTE
jgi:hypothetical protein